MGSTTNSSGGPGSVMTIRALRVTLPNGTVTWTVCDADGLPIEPVDEYLRNLLVSDYSTNSIKAYARHLSLLFRWLALRGLTWERLRFEDLQDFVEAVTLGTVQASTAAAAQRRSPATLKAVLSAVEGFLEYHRLEGRGPVDLRLHREASHRPRRGPGHFLQHVSDRRPVLVRRIRVPQSSATPAVLPEGLADEDLFAACTSVRDQLLVSFLLDAGLRIGQALGVQHEDVDPMRKRVTVTRRRDNPNGALSKQRGNFDVAVPDRTMDLYRAYLLGPLAQYDIQTDLVLVSLHPGHLGKPMTYSNAYELIRRLGARVGHPLHPHMFRHEHGTRLARQGWTAPEIAKRLGHSNASSADVYIHLTSNDVERRFEATADRLWMRPTP